MYYMYGRVESPVSLGRFLIRLYSIIYLYGD